jgi:hypothetical protein
MADAMASFRTEVDKYFKWDGVCLEEKHRRLRSAAQVSLLLLDASCDDGRSELLHAKILTLLMGERYRSHGGVLFIYQNGGWSSDGSSLSSTSIDFILQALRRAQAYFAVMGSHKPRRGFAEVAHAIRTMQSLDEGPLLDWQINDVQGHKPELKAKHWFYGLSDLCRELRRTFSEHNKNILKNFHRWADCDLAAKQYPGLAFNDCYLATANGKITPLPKDPRHGCYVKIPANLAWKAPDHSRQRLAALLLSSFAGNDGLHFLLNQCALVASRLRQPDIVGVFVGGGHDGKSMILVDFMRACWGSGFGNPPCTMLQVEREFQQQGLNFFQCVMLTFDECRRDQGLVEDVVKVFLGGGKMPLRKNHEGETKYASWEYCGKNWNMNLGDIPHVPTAEEKSHARRYRCNYMRATLTNDPEKVDVANKVFLADPDAKNFCSHGESVWSFFHDFLFPLMEQTSPKQWSDALEFMAPGSQMMNDTEWLLKRMARATSADNPDDPTPEAQPHACSSNASKAEALVRETHLAIAQPVFTAWTVNRTPLKSNHGSCRGKDKKLKSQYLEEAIVHFPHLVRVESKDSDSSSTRFERRVVDLPKLESALRAAAEDKALSRYHIAVLV